MWSISTYRTLTPKQVEVYNRDTTYGSIPISTSVVLAPVGKLNVKKQTKKAPAQTSTDANAAASASPQIAATKGKPAPKLAKVRVEKERVRKYAPHFTIRVLKTDMKPKRNGRNPYALYRDGADRPP